MVFDNALMALGAKKFVWVDDKFNETPGNLAKLLIHNREVSIACKFEEFDAIVPTLEIDESRAFELLSQTLEDLPLDRLNKIRSVFFQKEAVDVKFATTELSDSSVEEICGLLKIGHEDRWTFERAFEEISNTQFKSDDGIAYILDLNESGGDEIRGLRALQLLAERGFRGDAFILTHSATISTEAEVEVRLRTELGLINGDPLYLPVCVISKERLLDKSSTDELKIGLAIGVKRAGLRRSMFDVIESVEKKIELSFRNAAKTLLSVPPEQLESFVFERGYREGVSELHVVERILTAQIGQDMRRFFGSDNDVLRSVFRIRELRNIDLDKSSVSPDENMARFRMAEIWESDELINRSFSPIACGDVFETDRTERHTTGLDKRFVLLVQQCDVALRPDGKRAQETAFLVLLKKQDEGAGREEGQAISPKLYPLPFKIDGEKWVCDFRKSSVVRLSVLDLASFREDGRVRVDDGHTMPNGLLVSQQTIYRKRTSTADEKLHASAEIVGGGTLKDGLQLCISQTSPFNQIHSAKFFDTLENQLDDDPSDNKKRVTWGLQRVGRIRQPYIAALVDQHLGVMGRHAFDVDFMDNDNE